MRSARDPREPVHNKCPRRQWAPSRSTGVSHLNSKVVVVTGASSGLGRLSVEALALAGHTVYAAMRDIAGHNASRAEAAAYFAKDNGVDLRSVEMDVRSTISVDAAVDKIFNANGR